MSGGGHASGQYEQGQAGFRTSYPSAQQTPGHYIGESSRRPIFDEKTATSDQMRYTGAKNKEWLKTTSNYLISKAYEMKELLPWAESFQSHEITSEHIAAIAGCGLCMDAPVEKLSLDLWAYLNLCLHGEQKMVFNNVEPGNGFDAWRRIVVPIGPRSEAQLHRMHRSVHNPPTSKRLGDVLHDLDAWEGRLNEFYRCGGETIPDGTKIIIAMSILPSNTDTSIVLALKNIRGYAEFKDAIRDNVRFISEHTQRGAPSHVVEQDAHR